MATGIFEFRVRSLLEAEARQASATAWRVLCACLPGEQHELGLLAISYSLAIRGARITMLGADVPFADLYKACTALAPRATLLSVSTRTLFEASKVELLEFRERLDPRAAVVIGGSGVSGDDSDISRSALMVIPPTETPSATAEALLEKLALPDSDVGATAG